MQYIALLRGINVGGHTVKMERLKSIFAGCGVTAVRSFITSGNIFFTTERQDREVLTKEIESHLAKELGFNVPVFLRTVPELERVSALNPFEHIVTDQDTRFCVMFLKDLPKIEVPTVSPKGDLEIIQLKGNEAYVVWHIIAGRPPAPAFTDKVLGKETTTRFFHTTLKILQAARQ